MKIYKFRSRSLLLFFLTLFLCAGCNQIPTSITQAQSTAKPVDNPISANKYLFRFMRDGKFGYINEQGKIVIPAQFARADDFSEGLAGVRIDGKYGMIDQKGNIVIKPQYEFIFQFKNGQAKFLESGGRIGIIDRTGKIIKAATIDQNPAAMQTPISDGKFREGRNFSEGLARITGSTNNQNPQAKDKYGYVNQQGVEVIKPQFDYAADGFHEGLAWVVINGKLGYIDKHGKIVISPQFINHGGCCNGDFHQGLARVHQNRKSGYIDKQGKIILPIKFDLVAPEFHEGLAWVVANKKLGFVDRSGKIVIPLQFDYRRVSKDGRAGVTACNDKHCFSSESNFKNGLAVVKIGDEYGYIDKTGKILFDSRKR
jgi:WG containing repeat